MNPRLVVRDITDPLSKPGGGRLVVKLSWGNVLAIVLPGSVAVLIAQYLIPSVSDLLTNLTELDFTAGMVLLFISGLGGGVFEAVRLVTLDRAIETTRAENLYSYVTIENLPLFEAGVDNSYKYYCFYGNLICAVAILVVTRLLTNNLALWDLIFLPVGIVLIYAAIEQHARFEGFVRGFIESEKAKRGIIKPMLRNWPKAGANIRFVQTVNFNDGTVIENGTIGQLAQDPDKKIQEAHSDMFVVRIGERLFNVRRSQIELFSK